jgi:hypothetical protein
MLKISKKNQLFFESFCEREIREFFGKIQEYVNISPTWNLQIYLIN